MSDSGVVHWDGTAWATSGALNGARAVRRHQREHAQRLRCVGSGGDEYRDYDGHTWAVSTVVPSGGVLTGVAAIDHNDVWAIGSLGNGPLVMHYAGTWSIQTIPMPTSATAVTLSSVDAYGSNSVWVSGTYYASGYYQTLIEY